MCLALPGRIQSIDEASPLRYAIVDFDGVRRNVSLACVPEAGVGELVLVHAGFAISRIDEDGAREALRWLTTAERT